MQTLPSHPSLPRRSLAARLGITSIAREELVRRHALPASRFVTIAGNTIHYVDEGHGKPIVLLHGFGASLHTWNGVAAELARERRVIRVDLPPFGVTGPLRAAGGTLETMDIDAYRRFIDQFVDALGLTHASFVGNSLGGLIAWDYALRHRGAVHKLVLIDAVGFPMKLPFYVGLFNNPFVRVSASWLMPETIVKSAVRDVYGDKRKLDAVTLARYVDFFHGEDTRAAIVKMVPTLNFDALPTDALATLDIPTLVLWGGKDRWIPPAHAQQFAQRIPGARLIVYPELGHIPMEEAPQRVLPDLQAFLATAHTAPSDERQAAR
ncbi:alpha/beta fold hydrolase [Trinickia fusca]|uniref:Alpha/beta fold hydrolase n=1 Tax=Trinickia fusca TaxID=2419777 RepID=A0A494XSL7_9BURK|nr:alpha/beta fold hydrolase [Trinickia fusca]RKP52651.1 alpha/beta fold hydrolase [Trinickia fusca]